MSEFDLTETEQAQVAADCAGVIGADRKTAYVYRPQTTGDDSFDGPTEDSFSPAATLPVDFKAQPDSDVLEPDCDCVADTAGDLTTTLQKMDRVVIDNRNYRITHLQPFGLAGAEMFTRLQLNVEDGEPS